MRIILTTFLFLISFSVFSQNFFDKKFKEIEKYSILYIEKSVTIEANENDMGETSFKIEKAFITNGTQTDTLDYNYNENLSFIKIINDLSQYGWIYIEKIKSEEVKEDISINSPDKYFIIYSYLLKRKIY